MQFYNWNRLHKIMITSAMAYQAFLAFVGLLWYNIIILYESALCHLSCLALSTQMVQIKYSLFNFNFVNELPFFFFC